MVVLLTNLATFLDSDSSVIRLDLYNDASSETGVIFILGISIYGLQQGFLRTVVSAIFGAF